MTSRALSSDAENFLKISQQHGMGYYLALSRLYLSLGRTRLGGATASMTSANRWRIIGIKAIGSSFLAFLGFLRGLKPLRRTMSEPWR